MDHGALGTAMIGLDAVRREQEWSGRLVARRPRPPRGHRIRFALAGTLRGLADLLEPRRPAPSPNRA